MIYCCFGVNYFEYQYLFTVLKVIDTGFLKFEFDVLRRVGTAFSLRAYVALLSSMNGFMNINSPTSFTSTPEIHQLRGLYSQRAGGRIGGCTNLKCPGISIKGLGKRAAKRSIVSQCKRRRTRK